MRFWTKSELITKVENDLDLRDEIYITPEEMLGYLNEAIDEAEAHIHDIYEDYFLTKTTVTLVNGTAGYDLPADIYGNKIRGIVFNDGSTIYALKRIRGGDEFIEAALINQYSNSTDFYKYILTNSSTSGYKIELFPTPGASGTLTIWYIRNAKELVDDTDACDIPEAANYIMQFMKVRCYEKEPGHPNNTMAQMALAKLEQRFIDTMSNRVDDSDTTIVADLSFYEEFDQFNGGFR